MTPQDQDLRTTLHRLADSTTPLPVDDGLWRRGQSARRRGQVLVAAAVLAIIASVTWSAVLLGGDDREARTASPVGSRGRRDPEQHRATSPTTSTVTTDLAVGRGSAAFVSGSGDPVVITATDGRRTGSTCRGGTRPRGRSRPSGDGRTIAYQDGSGETGTYLAVVDLETGRSERRLLGRQPAPAAERAQLVDRTDAGWPGSRPRRTASLRCSAGSTPGPTTPPGTSPVGHGQRRGGRRRLRARRAGGRRSPHGGSGPRPGQRLRREGRRGRLLPRRPPRRSRSVRHPDVVHLRHGRGRAPRAPVPRRHPRGGRPPRPRLARRPAAGAAGAGHSRAAPASSSSPPPRWARPARGAAPSVASTRTSLPALSVAVDLVPDLDGTSSQQLTHDFGDPPAGARRLVDHRPRRRGSDRRTPGVALAPAPPPRPVVQGEMAGRGRPAVCPDSPHHLAPPGH